MAVSQSKSGLERELMTHIRQEEISSPDQFNEAVMRVFDRVIGEHGKAEFQQFVLPRLLKMHRGNYEAAGSRAIRIMDEGSYKKRGEIGEYFKTALGTQTAERKTPKVTRKSQGRSEGSKAKQPEHKPQIYIVPKFISLTSQDRLAEGLLRTVNRGYIKISGGYSIDTPNNLHRFSYEQDRLSEGLIKFRYFVTEGEKSVWDDRYVSIDKVLKMKGRVIEGPSCFVATAVYGNPKAPEVQVLREFRDEVLNQNPLGRRLVDFYYSSAGERTANLIEKVPVAVPLIRKGLDLLVEVYSAKRN